MGVDTAQLVLSCEHASRAIPQRYRPLFNRAKRALQSHHGSDIGSQVMGRHLAKALDVELTCATTSRLLVDCNRSQGHPRLFSRYTASLDENERARILADYYYPYRQAVENRIDRSIALHGRAIHVSVHSFSGRMNGQKRNTDIGLLYDPGRKAERDFCAEWQKRLKDKGVFRVRRNYPYKGISDGLVTYFRKSRSARRYLAIELEFNQDQVDGPQWLMLRKTLAQTLGDSLVTPI